MTLNLHYGKIDFIDNAINFDDVSRGENIMRTESLRYFVEVAKTGSIRTAADNLYMTQPALTTAIKSLEKELGYPLFERSHIGVVLTEYGQMTLEIARDILEKTNRFDFIRYMYRHHKVDELQGQLLISTVLTVSLELLQGVVPIFSRAYPNVELVIMERNSSTVIDDVLHGRSDIGFCAIRHGEFEQEVDENCIVKLLWEEKLYAIVQIQSELARKKSVSLKQISQYPLALMAFAHEDHAVQESLLKDYPQVKINMRSSNFKLTQHHILSTGSVGLAFIASVKDFSQTFLEGLTLVPISNNSKAGFYIVYQKENNKNELIATFIAILEEVLKLPNEE